MMIGFDAGPQRDTPRRVFQELTMGHAEFTLRNQPTQKPLSLDELWMPFTPNRDFKADPRIVVKAEGMYYWNDRGEKIIDASSGLFCVAAGHGRKEIAEAVHRQLCDLDFVAPFLRAHPKSFELASRVAELTPGDLNHIFFVNSGSEAVDTAMKVALAYHLGATGPVHASSGSRRGCISSSSSRWPCC